MEVKDVFGIEPIAQAGLEVTKTSLKGVSSFLDIVCKPALQELGFLAQDKIRQWRLNNIVHTLEKAKGRMCYDGQSLQLTANARVSLSIMEECSKVDNDELQELWAGLFISSCTPDGKDDSNMNFVDLLRRMSSVEARIIDYACRTCTKSLYPNKLILANELYVPFDKIVKIAGTNDIYRLDSELDHMRSIELLTQSDSFTGCGGFVSTDAKLEANITPSALALNLFYRTHSIGKTPIEFWGSQLMPHNTADEEKEAADMIHNSRNE